MSKKLNTRKQLGKEQYELIKRRNSLRLFIDCSIAYGSLDEAEVFKLQEELEVLNGKIETLRLLRSALKEE